MENSEPSNTAKLSQKKNKVVQAVTYVQKTGDNKMQGYKYATDEEVLKHIRTALVEAGLSFSVEATGFEITHDIPTRQGNAMKYIKIDLVCSLTDTETGYMERCQWFGAAADSGDKALYKAFTGGIKYFLMKTFLLPTGNDPEADENVDKATQAKAKPPAARKANPAPPPEPTAKPKTPKDVFWDSFKWRCEKCEVEVPKDKKIIKRAVETLCSSLEVSRKADEMKRVLPMASDKPENENWEILTAVIVNYPMSILIGKAILDVAGVDRAA